MRKKTDERPPARPLPLFAEPLLSWFRQNAREMPWRSDPTPYHVLLSEIMLQQTRVEAVRGYYARFLEAFPTVDALAAAEEQAVLKRWEGLGYYSRARNLHAAARQIAAQGFPDTFEGLLALPGVGRYTAGAVASIAFGLREPCVDGNVLRVLTRYCADTRCIDGQSARRWAEDTLRPLLPKERPGDLNQAVMELGALVCVPGEPRCGLCPLAADCAGLGQGLASALPVRAEKRPRRVEERTVFLLLCGDFAALRRRPDGGVLAGLWEYPNVSGALDREQARVWLFAQGAGETCPEPLPAARHIFTHMEWSMTGYAVRLPALLPGFEWVPYDALLRSYPIPTAFRRYSEALARLLRP